MTHVIVPSPSLSIWGLGVVLQQQRQEEDIRTRMSTAAELFRKAVTETQQMRQEYFNFQLPRILRVRILSFLFHGA